SRTRGRDLSLRRGRWGHGNGRRFIICRPQRTSGGLAALESEEQRQARRPPRPPHEATAPILIHTPEGPPNVRGSPAVVVAPDAGPSWVRAPPPRYHLSEPGHLGELPSRPIP